MVTQLGEAQIPIRATLDKLDADLEKARGKVGGVIEGIVGNVQKVGGIALGIGGAGIAAIGGIGAALGKMAIDAAPVESLSTAFDGLAESAGVGADEMLAALKRGSAGMVAQRDLMTSFNQAASLVSLDFAKQLPDAMQYLGKVSASTGQDMGFLLDSLVKGVGRLSPMILDNLQVQVSLAEATERASEMFGVEAGALTKAQVQAGMMNVTLEKLAANTASMPDVTETAAAKMARLKATFQDTKDQIGMAFLPVLNTVLGVLANVGERVLPILTGALETVAPVVATIAEAFATFIGSILEGQDPLVAFKELLAQLVPPEVVETVMGIVESIRGFIAAAQEALAPVMEWIGQNVELQDVLIALGIAIAAVVLPALWSIITAAAPIIATALALIAIVMLLRKAWESDFLGIRTFILETLDTIKAWWAEHGEQVIAKAVEIYTRIREFIQEALDAIKAWWAEHGEAILAKANEIWQAIVAVFDWFVGQYSALFEAFRLAFEGDWTGFGEKLREIWDESWRMIKEIGSQVWEAIKRFFSETDWGSIGRSILDGIARGISAGAGKIKEAAKSAARAAYEAAKAFLRGGSPSKLFMELGVDMMRGMVVGVGRMESAVAASTESALHVPHVAVPAGAGPMGGPQINIYFGTDSVRSDQDIYRLTEQMERTLELRGVRRSIG